MPQTLKNIETNGEIVLYQPDDSLSLEVKLENETVKFQCKDEDYHD